MAAQGPSTIVGMATQRTVVLCLLDVSFGKQLRDMRTLVDYFPDFLPLWQHRTYFICLVRLVLTA